MERRFTETFAKQQKINEEQGELIQRQAAIIEALGRENEARVLTLQTEVARLTRDLIGRKTEKTKIPSVDRDRVAHDEPPSEEELARRREQAEKKRRENALAKGAALTTQDVEHPVPDEMKVCPTCGGTECTELPPEVSATIEYVPGRFVKHRHRRQKLVRRCACPDDRIVTAPAPPKLIEGGHYGPGFAAFLIVEKCVDSIPIYRIEKRFGRLGIPMSRSTMNDIVLSAADILSPLVARLKVRMASVEIVLADETSMRLQDRKKRGFVWVFHGHDQTSGGELALYVFTVDRSSTTPIDILGGTEGTLLVDGYTGYNAVEDPSARARAGCWCHSRRKFFEAKSTAPEEATHAIDEIRKLFRVEHEAKLRQIVGSSEHLALRHEKSTPVLGELYDWLEDAKKTVLPKSPIATAINYTINQKARLELFLRDARIPIHNNSSESRLRVIALARKNYLFFGHPRAGRSFASLYSLVGSCIANGVEPTAYLTDVLMRVRDAESDEHMDALLPDRWRAGTASAVEFVKPGN